MCGTRRAKSLGIKRAGRRISLVTRVSYFKYSTSRSRSFRGITWACRWRRSFRFLHTRAGLGLSAGLPAPLGEPDPAQEDGEPQNPCRHQIGPPPAPGIPIREGQEQTEQERGEHVGRPTRHAAPTRDGGLHGAHAPLAYPLALIQKLDLCPQVSHSVGDDRHDDDDKEDQNHHSLDVHLPSPTSSTPPAAPVASAA